ncbi:hypothetical protein AB0L04_22790 [Streptomyces glaucescens]|uniref:hypothetical protein n=1 Tax=Streptomyces glaucescens TaxID=1907 RepID=UPI00344D3CBA
MAAGLGGALLLGACGGGSGDEAAPTAPASSPAPTASASPAPTGSPSGAAPGELEGSWLATSGGQAVALVITGDEAGLFASRGTVCGGRVGESAGQRTVRLSCGGADRSRGTGTVDSVTSTTLRVTWAGSAGTETYTRAEGGKLPSGLPTADAS